MKEDWRSQNREALARSAQLMYAMLKKIADSKEPWSVYEVKKVLKAVSAINKED